jgi:hypothetical protein
MQTSRRNVHQTVDYNNIKQLKELAKEKRSVSEARIVDSILKYLNTLPEAKFLKRHGSAFGKGGEPDITGCLGGSHVEIEVKRPGEKPTQRQLAALKEWQGAKAVALWVTSLDEVKSLTEFWRGSCQTE